MQVQGHEQHDDVSLEQEQARGQAQGQVQGQEHHVQQGEGQEQGHEQHDDV